MSGEEDEADDEDETSNRRDDEQSSCVHRLLFRESITDGEHWLLDDSAHHILSHELPKGLCLATLVVLNSQIAPGHLM